MKVLVSRSVLVLSLLLAAVLSACGSCPQCNCPVCPAPVPEQQTAIVNTGPCTEEWVHMPVLIGFPTGGAEIDAQNRAILQEVVSTARSRTDIRRVRIEGHADTCGAEINNQALSVQRADVVAAELVTMGVPRDMMETVGYGSTQPRANEACERRGRTDDLSRQTNRRVEFSILVCRTAP